jgi:hypothetical protein
VFVHGENSNENGSYNYKRVNVIETVFKTHDIDPLSVTAPEKQNSLPLPSPQTKLEIAQNDLLYGV